MNISDKIDQARSRVNSRALDRMLDDQRLNFLDRLHVASQAVLRRDSEGIEMIIPPRIKLTEWEKRFVADLVTEHRPLTQAQRDSIDELRHRFQSRL